MQQLARVFLRGAGPRVLATAMLLLCAIAGCSSAPADKEQVDGGDQDEPGLLRVLVIDDPGLATVVERHWLANSESDLEMRQATSAEIVASDATTLDADVVIYPAGLLGELATRRLIVPVPEKVRDDGELNRGEIFKLERLASGAWGGELYGLTFGSPQLMLNYRADIFEKLGLQPPQTWDEYQRLSLQLADREALGDLAPPGDAPWYGTVEPLGPGWGGQMLLARAAAYARNRGSYATLFRTNSLEPLIDTEPFVRALDELVAAARSGPDNGVAMSPHDARRELLAGRCAMALTWQTAAGELPDAETAEPSSTKTISLGFAELPGSTDVFSLSGQRWEQRREGEGPRVPLLGVAGRLGSVTRECRRARAAFNMLIWLTGPKNSTRIAASSSATTLYRHSQVGQATSWVAPTLDARSAAAYAAAVEQANDSVTWLYSIRIPGRGEYLDALDLAVRQAVAGEKTSAEALSAAAQQWREITQRRGLESQRDAYGHSLGVGS